MKIVVFSDVHGDIEALQTFMKTDDYKTADKRIFLGDGVCLGPCPNECLERLFSDNIIYLLGNHDSYMAFGLPEEEGFSESKIQHQNYMRNITREELKAELRKMPKEYSFSVGKNSFYFTHYMWESDRLVVDNPESISAENVYEIFKDIKANYVFYGHEHNPSFFETNGKFLVGVGSLGMIYPGNYAVLDINGEKVDIDIKKLDYNIDKVIKDILDKDYPRAERYVKFFKLS